MSADPPVRSGHYRNPVYNYSFPDPFVLRWAGRYFAYGTGGADDGRVFPVLTSDDLVNWSYAGGAMTRLDPDHIHYWAPEASYRDGRFYLYYSVGNETEMEIRVAMSDRPDGGFVDAGVRLTKEPFAIDAHVFRDTDGTDYLFYATDYLEHSHIGTGTAVDRMISPTELAGSPRPVSRAKYDWQVYHPNRPEKGYVRWHTVEGPAVFKRKGKYFQMFSGGNWQNDSYGVSYAVSNDITDPDEWRQVSDGLTTFPILRSIDDRIIGPGHNSIALGPNGRELYCIYHEWVNGERVPAIDRMDVAGDRIFLIGPTDTPQAMPYKPQQAKSSFTLGAGTSSEWPIGPDSLLETYFSVGDGWIDIELLAGGEAVYTTRVESQIEGVRYLRAELVRRSFNIEVDRVGLAAVTLPTAPDSLRLTAHSGRTEFQYLSVTGGFEELFLSEDLAARGWNAKNEAVEARQLTLTANGAEHAGLSRTTDAPQYEICLNIEAPLEDGTALVLNCGPSLHMSAAGGNWKITDAASRNAALIEHGTFKWRQLKLVVQADRYELSVEGEHLLTGASRPTGEFGIIVTSGEVRIEMIRYTELNVAALS